MNNKEQLYYLVIAYHKNKYSTSNFCNQLTDIFYHHLEENDLEEKEYNLFMKLCEIADRYSEFDEDLLLSNVFLSESQFRFEFNKMINNFTEIMPNYNWKSL